MPRWLFLAVRSRRYRAGLRQRAGFVPPMPPGCKRLWIHCASVGEAAVPVRVVEQLKKACPQWDIVFSSCTDTGVGRLRKLYPGSEVFYFPFDLSPCVETALGRVKPAAFLLVEQEIWPNMLAACRRRRIPAAIINGRMNERSSHLVRALLRLFPQARKAVELCCVRSMSDAGRFEYAGIERCKIVNTGSLKYEALDTHVPEASLAGLRDLFRLRPGDMVIVAGSTHGSEEIVLARIWERLRLRYPSLRLIIAPRHIERSAHVADVLRGEGCGVRFRTELGKCGKAPGRDVVFIMDTIGELAACYALATVVFVGRSLFPPGGGQNIMEPAALARPVVTGLYTSNFKPELEALTAAGGVRVAENEAQLEEILDFLLKNNRDAEELGGRAQRAVLSNRGATADTMAALVAFAVVLPE